MWDDIQAQLWWWGCLCQRSPREQSVVKSTVYITVHARQSFVFVDPQRVKFFSGKSQWIISLFICKLFKFRGLHPPFFLCYLLQNNYRNRGNFCLVFEYVNEKWKQHRYITGSKVRHSLHFASTRFIWSSITAWLVNMQHDDQIWCWALLSVHTEIHFAFIGGSCAGVLKSYLPY